MINDDILKIVMGLRPIDDDLMRVIFMNNIPLVEYTLRIILNKDDLVVESSETQYELGFFGSHKLFLDVFAKDSSGKSYNIEVQRADSGATAKRARFHASAIDVNELPKGSDYEDLPDTYVIFITENDVIKGNKPTYTIERTIAETGESFNDGTHIIYVNGAYKDIDTAIGKLIHDFVCKNASEMLCEPMAEITKKYKNTQEGVDYMCKAVEDYVKEYGKKERQEGVIETIKSFIKDGSIPLEKIAEIVKLPLEEVKKIAATI